MNKSKLSIIFLIIIGVIYFCLFIPANLTGAKDPVMIGIFESDEYAQYPNVIQMLTPGETTYQTIRNFVVYLHYWYGYPFYLFSALAILPVKIFGGGNWSTMTSTIMLVLRQFISVLPTILSVGILVFIQTRFKSWLKSIALFILLLAIPALISNNLWWHLDSLGLLSVCLVFLFLFLDDLRFGKFFYWAAIFCGIGAGIKYLGCFFVLTIPVYIVWGILTKKITWKKSLVVALIFVVVMLATFIITNPLLLLPIERGEIINIQRMNIAENRSGFYVIQNATQDLYSSVMQEHYGKIFFLLLAFIATVLTIDRKPQYRLINVLILTYTIPLAVLFYSGSTIRTHYFIPVLVPIYSALVHLFPGEGIFTKAGTENTSSKKVEAPYHILRFLPWLFTILMIFQTGLFVQKDFSIVNTILQREQNSKSIAFYHDLENELFAKLPADQPLTIYRDWRVYVPENSHWTIQINWDMATMDYINQVDPDVILLERENVKLFSDENTLNAALEPAEMVAIYNFYRAALENNLAGYTLVKQNNFGYAFLRTSLYNKYLK